MRGCVAHLSGSGRGGRVRMRQAAPRRPPARRRAGLWLASCRSVSHDASNPPPYEPPERLRRKLLGPIAVLLHRAAMPLAGLLTRKRVTGGDEGRIHILLEHAWGVGGTIRTTFNL